MANRLVVPTLQSADLSKFSSGELKLDVLTKKFIHDQLDYQFAIVGSSKEAYQAESLARRGELFGEKPLLNPL